jgi:hypothetical protein
MEGPISMRANEAPHPAVVVACGLSPQVAKADAGEAQANRDTQEHANKWLVLALSAAAVFMTTLDSSIVNIGLPSAVSLRCSASGGASSPSASRSA